MPLRGPEERSRSIYAQRARYVLATPQRGPLLCPPFRGKRDVIYRDALYITPEGPKGELLRPLYMPKGPSSHFVFFPSPKTARALWGYIASHFVGDEEKGIYSVPKGESCFLLAALLFSYPKGGPNEALRPTLWEETPTSLSESPRCLAVLWAALLPRPQRGVLLRKKGT